MASRSNHIQNQNRWNIIELLATADDNFKAAEKLCLADPDDQLHLGLLKAIVNLRQTTLETESIIRSVVETDERE